MKEKIVGRRRSQSSLRDPAKGYWRAEQLIQEMNILNPYPRPRGFVFKAKTREEYESWRSKQRNPRLW